MKILIDSRGANWYRGTGIGTYTYNLLKHLITIKNNNLYTLLWSGENFKEFQSNNCNIIMASKKHRKFFEEFYVPNYIENHSINLYHIPQNGIGLSPKKNSLNIVTIHDLIPYVLPETTGRRYLKNFLYEMPQIIENTDGILTVSNYSKNDILKFFPSFPEERIFVTPLAANSTFKVLDKEKALRDVQKKYNFTGDYIMYLGGFSTRKNVLSLIKAFNEIVNYLNTPTKLLIVGSLKDEGLKLREFSSTLKEKDNIIFIGFVEEDYLPTMYNGCKLFVYPSIYEGFGLPPLEAMNCGTPVLASNITSIPEVVLDKEMLFNIDKENDLKEKLLNLLNNNDLLSKCSQKALDISSKFTWDNTALLTEKAYSSLLSLGKRN
ncbi:glycosyltransferase family 4 protein [Clostridium sp.]|uniref:glycosyltransferase family 4 protein n=1 Tax=Clostridium sp. TaxID=1506 RepID=UPI0039912741